MSSCRATNGKESCAVTALYLLAALLALWLAFVGGLCLGALVERAWAWLAGPSEGGGAP